MATKKQFFCPLHGTSEGVRVSGIFVEDTDQGKTLDVSIECMTCPDHLGTIITLPIEVMDDYDLEGLS